MPRGETLNSEAMLVVSEILKELEFPPLRLEQEVADKLVRNLHECSVRCMEATNCTLKADNHLQLISICVSCESNNANDHEFCMFLHLKLPRYKRVFALCVEPVRPATTSL